MRLEGMWGRGGGDVASLDGGDWSASHAPAALPAE